MTDRSDTYRRASLATKPTYIYEIQGLRTVAALLVAIYHIWFQRVSGGVDVFFVVSAYFMVGSFVRKAHIGFGSVIAYYTSTFRRILPGTITVVLATIAGCLILLPHSVWTAELTDALGSILFMENWVLARSGQNYLDQGMSSSAFQQMWALSLQVQFYILFPLIFLIGEFIARRSGRDRSTVLITLLTILFFLSFAFSIYLTLNNQPLAYFHAGTRVWEFAAGGLTALLIGPVRMGTKVARIIGLAALIVLLTFGRLIDVSSQFPGYVALVPVLTTIAIFISASNGGRIPVLSWNAFVKAGDYSFAFYLWHWPILTFARLLLMREEVGLIPGVAIMVLAAVLAYLTTQFLESPFRRNAWLSARTPLAIASCAALVAAGLAGTYVWDHLAKREIAIGHKDLKSYLANHDARRPIGAPLVPAPIIVKGDIHEAYSDGCHQKLKASRVITCEYGAKAGAIKVVVVGGSHSLQWLPVLEKIARRRDLKIYSMTKSACMLSFSDSEHEMQDSKSCLAWNRDAVAKIKRIRPDVVFTIATRSVQGHDAIPVGYRQAWKAIADAGIRIIGLRDNPWMGRDIPYCVELRGKERDICGIPKDAFYGPVSAIKPLIPANMIFADYSASYCPNGFCSVVQDGVLMYRDRHHLTKTYVYEFEHEIEQDLDRALHL